MAISIAPLTGAPAKPAPKNRYILITAGCLLGHASATLEEAHAEIEKLRASNGNYKTSSFIIAKVIATSEVIVSYQHRFTELR